MVEAGVSEKEEGGGEGEVEAAAVSWKPQRGGGQAGGWQNDERLATARMPTTLGACFTCRRLWKVQKLPCIP